MRLAVAMMVCACWAGAAAAQAVPGTVPGQSAPGSAGGYRIISPVNQPSFTTGQIELIDLETRFAEAVARDGGRAFADWVADDVVVLNNGKPAVLGRGAVLANAQWDPKVYHLGWTPEGAQMGPLNDMGFTWGHYEGDATGPDGQKTVTTGRYMTVWKKTKAGWKVAMEASSNEPAGAGECCALPKP